jgi:hypothetical protein
MRVCLRTVLLSTIGLALFASCAFWYGYDAVESPMEGTFHGWRVSVGGDQSDRLYRKTDWVSFDVVMEEAVFPPPTRLTADSLRFLQDSSGSLPDTLTAARVLYEVGSDRIPSSLRPYDMSRRHFVYTSVRPQGLPKMLTVRVYFTVVDVSTRSRSADSLDYHLKYVRDLVIMPQV